MRILVTGTNGQVGHVLAALLAEQARTDPRLEVIALDRSRMDLADIEAAEMTVLAAYLPQRLSADEVSAEVKAIVAELGATGPGDMGKVMAAVKTRLAGKADMGQVSAAVKAALAP